MKLKSVIRIEHIDRGSLRKPVITEDGFMRISGYAARVGIQDYRQMDGSVIRELRPPDEVFSQASLDSYTGKPFTNDHPGEPVSPDNATTVTKGAVLSACPEGDYVAFDAMVYDGETQADMRGDKRQLSAGYRVSLDMTSGTHPVYGPYDAIQRNIRVNHLALVDEGRAGPGACVQMDSLRMDGADIAIAVVNSKRSDRMMNAKQRANLEPSDFAVPATRQLPIPDEEHVRAAMARFGEAKFVDAGEKRTAFNRIVARAKELNIDPSGFVKEWGDRLDSNDTNPRGPAMPTDEDKKKTELSVEDQSLVDAAMKKYAEQKLRADNAVTALAAEKTRADKAEGRCAEVEQKLKDEKENRVDAQALADKDAKIKELTKERDDARNQVKTLSDPELLRAASVKRANIIAKSDPILNADAGKKPLDLHGMTDKEIMVDTIMKRRGEDVGDRSDDYIASRWETTVEDFADGEAAMASLREATIVKPKGTPARTDSVKSAREDYLERKQTGWKKPGQKEAI